MMTHPQLGKVQDITFSVGYRQGVYSFADGTTNTELPSKITLDGKNYYIVGNSDMGGSFRHVTYRMFLGEKSEAKT